MPDGIAEPPKDPQKVEVKTANVSLAKGAHRGLVVIGGLLIVLVIVVGAVDRFAGSETKEVTTPAKVKGEKEEKVTETKAVISDTLLTTLLGAGAALILVGVLYARISAIKLPGGTEIDLLNKDDVKASADAVAKEAEQKNTQDPKAIAAATAETLAIVNQEKTSSAQELPAEAYEQAAAKAFEATP